MQEIEKAPSFPQDEAVNTIDNVSKIHRNPLLNKDAAVNFGLLSSDNEDELKESKSHKFLSDILASRIPQGIDIPEPDAIFSINGIPALTKKSISLLIAKAKAGKTTVAAWFVAKMLADEVRVLWIDSEQGEFYGSRTQCWILRIAGMETCDHLHYHNLKIFPPVERVMAVDYLIANYAYDLIVIDGVRDLIHDINSPEESTLMATKLMQWAETGGLHVLNILHTNKGDSNARGHVGAELTNKSEVVIEVTKDDNKVIVEPVYSRGEPFETFALERDSYGMPSMCEGWMPKAKERTSDRARLQDYQIYELLTTAFCRQPSCGYSDLVRQVKLAHEEKYGSIGDNKVKDLITIAKNNSWVTQESPKSKYIMGEYNNLSV